MANTLISNLGSIICREEIIYTIRDSKSLKKFTKWVNKNKLKPGDIIPKDIFNKYFKRI